MDSITYCDMAQRDNHTVRSPASQKHDARNYISSADCDNMFGWSMLNLYDVIKSALIALFRYLVRVLII